MLKGSLPLNISSHFFQRTKNANGGFENVIPIGLGSRQRAMACYLGAPSRSHLGDIKQTGTRLHLKAICTQVMGVFVVVVFVGDPPFSGTPLPTKKRRDGSPKPLNKDRSIETTFAVHSSLNQIAPMFSVCLSILPSAQSVSGKRDARCVLSWSLPG